MTQSSLAWFSFDRRTSSEIRSLGPLSSGAWKFSSTRVTFLGIYSEASSSAQSYSSAYGSLILSHFHQVYPFVRLEPNLFKNWEHLIHHFSVLGSDFDAMGLFGDTDVDWYQPSDAQQINTGSEPC